MANNCFYDMKIVGKKADIDKFINALSGKNPDGFNFIRVFSVDVYESDTTSNGKDYTCVCGDCAWSLDYAAKYSENMFAKLTKEYNLTVEAWSDEIGCGFQEHYLYDHGTEVIDEARNTTTYEWDTCDYPDYNDYKKNELDYSNDIPTEEEFINEGEQFDSTIRLVRGGWGDEFCIYSI